MAHAFGVARLATTLLTITTLSGMKGAGEAGAIGSCPAVMNAIIDALWRAFRISHLDMPATPERVWNAIQDIGRVRAL